MSECYVYLIVSDAAPPNGPLIRDASEYDRMCKVGISNYPNGRLATLQTASPFKLRLYRSWKFDSRPQAEFVERDVHKQISSVRLSGEWFFSDPELVADWVHGCMCSAAAFEWKWQPGRIRDFMIENGYPKENVRDLLGFTYGADVLA